MIWLVGNLRLYVNYPDFNSFNVEQFVNNEFSSTITFC